MGSSRPIDRSIGEATFLPQWMKGKLDTRFDYTESTFSPPADDTFFYIRYPRHEESAAPKEGFRPLNELLDNKSDSSTSASTASSNFLGAQSNVAAAAGKTVDFSKHPLPCQPYIPVSKPKIIVANKPKKPAAEDDFSNEKAAECGRSIVHVANQIMSSTFGKSASADSSTGPHQAESVAQDQQQQNRKGSRSLPVTPLTSPSGTPEGSPKSRRRMYGNRFFTGAFVPADGERKNGWLLTSILGQSRELIAPKIEEEEEPAVPPERTLSRKKSISSQNLAYFSKEDRAKIMQAKPSELREMNFWTPTSM